MKLRLLVLTCLFLCGLWMGFAQKKITLTVQDYLHPEEAAARFINEVVIPEFEARYPNVEVKHIYIPFEELLPTILQQAVAGALPDIVMADNPWVPQLIEAGVYKDITEKVLQELGEEFWLDFFEGHRLVTSKDGRIYALQLHTNNLALFYRRSLLDAAGIEKIPETWDELLNACEKLKTTLGIYGIVICVTASEEGTWQFEPFLWSNGGSLLELDQPPAIEALRFFTTLVVKGYMPRDVINVSGQGDLTQAWFIPGKAAMMINGNWEFGWQLTPDVLTELGDVGVAPIPVPSRELKSPLVPFGGECFGIASTIDATKFELAWEFMKILFAEKAETYYLKYTGDIPPRASYARLVWEQKPLFRPFIKQAKYALPRPLLGGIAKYPDVSMETILAVQKALAGIQDPEQAFIEAAAKIRALFTTQDEFLFYKNMAREILNKARERAQAEG